MFFLNRFKGVFVLGLCLFVFGCSTEDSDTKTIQIKEIVIADFDAMTENDLKSLAAVLTYSKALCGDSAQITESQIASWLSEQYGSASYMEMSMESISLLRNLAVLKGEISFREGKDIKLSGGDSCSSLLQQKMAFEAHINKNDSHK